MSYPGDPALSAEVRRRVQEAFRHSVDAAMTGNRQEAMLGCDFVLRLDPQFPPVKLLQQMIAQERSPETLRELLGTEGSPEPADAAAAAGGVLAAASGSAAAPGLVATFSRLLEARRFEELLGAAQAQAAAVAGHPKLKELVAQAQSRFDAEPFVRGLLDSARKALGEGRLEEVASLVAKARALDSSHPGAAEIERLRASAASMPTSLKIDWDDDAPPPPTAVRAPDELAPARAPVPPPPAQVAAEPEPIPEAPEEPFAEGPPDLDLPEVGFAMREEPVEFERPMDDSSTPDFSISEPPASAATEPGTTGGEGEDRRVRALLDEGQAAFEGSDYQAAIDAWSRIFLIDIDNEEAARRIERARQLKAEQEREIEEVFHEGVARFDAGEWDAAREAFRRVLAEQPSYVLAREYLDKLEERVASGEGPSALRELAPAATAPDVEATKVRARPALRSAGEEILVPPEPGARTEPRRPAVDGFARTAKRSRLPSPLFIAIGGGVLLLLAAGGWMLVTNWSRFFPNSGAPVVAEPSPAQNFIVRAKALQAEGKVALAIAQLRRVPPQDPAYGEAQSLVSQWEKLIVEQEPGLPAEKLSERRELVARATTAVEQQDHFLARRLLGEAAAVSPLAGAEEGRLTDEIDRAAAGYAEELRLIHDAEYEMALNRLWRRHEANPGELNTRRLMVDAYYNLSISDLQRGDPKAARAKLKEARQLDKNDPMLERLERFCATYERRNEDLLYRIFVKYLAPR